MSAILSLIVLSALCARTIGFTLSNPRPQERMTTALNSQSSSSSLSTSLKSTADFRVLSSIQDIVNDYDVFLLDMWGVMHDGTSAYNGVLEVIQQLKALNKHLIILSNSSKRQDSSIKMLTQLGFNPTTDFSKIITSGEVAYHLLEYLARQSLPTSQDCGKSSWVPSTIPHAFQNLPTSSSRKAFCFGSGDGDEEYLTSCGWSLAESVEEADSIVARGTFVILDSTKCVDKNKNEELYWQTYQEALKKAAKLKLPMIVCNPDKIRPDADRSPMPGTIGVEYEEQLLQEHGSVDSKELFSLVLNLGKPFVDVYDIALRDCTGKTRACMIGDALETDITGATAAGIDSIWVVNNGIHNEEVEASAGNQMSNALGSNDELTLLELGCTQVLTDFNRKSSSTYARGHQISPTIVLPSFRW